MELLQSLYSRLLSLDLISIFWVIIFLGGSIFVHELGHFIAAKRRKLFVPRFSIGFGPKLFAKNIKGTEFCVALLPLGGYVAIPQLMGIKELEGQYEIPENTPPISCADTIAVAAMGVVFNIIFAFILGTILWCTGMEQPQSSMNNIIGYVSAEITLPGGEKIPGPAKEAGLRVGDQIIAIDGCATRDLADITHAIALGKNRDQGGPLSTITVLRDGQQQNFTVRPVLFEQNPHAKESFRVIGIETFQELFVAKIYKNTPAQRAGLEEGDKIISVNGEKLFSYSQFNDALEREENLQLTVERGEKMVNISVRRERLFRTRPRLKMATTYGNCEVLPDFFDKNVMRDPYTDSCTLQLLSLAPGFREPFPEWAIGDRITRIQGQPTRNISESFSAFQGAIGSSPAVTVRSREFFLPVEKIELIPAESRHSIGIELCGSYVLVRKNPIQWIKETAQIIFLTLGSLISPSSDIHLKNLSGPPAILDALHTFAARDLRLLLWFVMVLNVNLAVINLLPLPVLDSGVIVRALLEKIFRRKIAAKMLMHTQLAFMMLILGVVIYISFFDISKILGRRDAERDYFRQRRLAIDEQSLWNGLGEATSQ
ncbi:MAG: site-2 protease family protein [Puniceicoccales bacterium]|jgi:RIP metalloprotease RseP|nr:site-2 protease family protein [Puniceicoccales bacterium]